MATSSTQKHSQGEPAPHSAQQPLSQKSDAQLKREAKARLSHLDPVSKHELINELLGKQVSQSVGGFLSFLRQHAIIGLAVGFVLATQVQAVAKQRISRFIDPLFQLLVGGGQTLSQRTVVWHRSGHAATFGWGAFVYALIDFVFVAVAIYVI